MRKDLDSLRTDLATKDRHQRKALERLEQRDRKIRDLESQVVALEKLKDEQLSQITLLKRELEG
jgi:hypothetical protein